MRVADQEMVCKDCGSAFVFTEAEQGYFQAQGFTNPPKRCLACRARARKRSRTQRSRPQARHPGDLRQSAAGAPTAAPHDGPGAAPNMTAVAPDPALSAPRPRPRRVPGTLHPATCSVCGSATEVPFQPDGVRPVYCLPCLKRRTR